MQKAPIPENEEQRLISLHNLGFLDTAPEERFDLITRTATKIFDVPISTLTLVDAKREWFKSCQGLPQHEGDRAISFCGHALVSNKIFVVPDTTKDKRFSDNPMVTGAPHIRFYAGVPLMSADGQWVGAFCIKDRKPRKFSKHDEDVLKGLASWAEVEINSRNLSLALREEHKIQAELRIKTAKLEKLDKSQEETKKAMLNVMEDLELTRTQLENEKVKDEAILANIGYGIMGVDNKGKIMTVNKAGATLLGFKEEELLGKSFVDVIKMEDEKGEIIPKDKRPINMALFSNKTTTATTKPYYQYIRSDGTKLPIALTVRPIISREKIGAIEVFRDINHELESDKAKSEFVSLASHQLRAPLTAISWYTEMLLADGAGKLTDEQKKYLDEIYLGNHRMIELVNALLNASRIDMGTIIIEPVLTDIVTLSKDIIKEMEPNIFKRKQAFHENYASDIPKISVDPKLMRIVFQNLLSNAIKYTPEKGTITLGIQKDEKNILISLSDTGYGIPKIQQNKMFTKFFRADNIKGKEPEGTGLGLYLLKSIVVNSGGTLRFESEENKGTTFYVTLPLSGMQKKDGTKQLN